MWYNIYGEMINNSENYYLNVVRSNQINEFGKLQTIQLYSSPDYAIYILGKKTEIPAPYSAGIFSWLTNTSICMLPKKAKFKECAFAIRNK